MKTQDLIRILAKDKTSTHAVHVTMAKTLVPAILMSLIVMWLVLGLRPDLAQAVFVPLSVTRFGFTIGLAVLALLMLLEVARPDHGPLWPRWPLGALAVLAGMLYAVTLFSTPSDAREMAMFGKTAMSCLSFIPVLAILPVTAIVWTLRQGATTTPRLASLLSGMAGGGVGAAIYALHCTEDNPLFYLTWYSLAVLLVTGLTTLIGPKLLRW
jgi:hypothetical protein